MNTQLKMQVVSLMIGTLIVALAPATSVADSNFYLGVSAGSATIEANLGDSGIPMLPTSFDENDTALKIFGGYDFDLPVIDLGVEVGYVDFGKPEVDLDGDKLSLDTTGFNAWGIVSFNVLLVDIYGKLGFIAWEADARLLNEISKEDGTDVGYGLGAAIELGPVEVRGEYEIYDLDDADISMLSLGLIYRF